MQLSVEESTEVAREYQTLRDQVDQLYGENGGGRRPSIVTERNALVLYALVRAAQPSVVVETGVSDGMSSSMILRALKANGSGTLVSIDFPLVGLPRLYGKKPGWIVPEDLRAPWRLHLGRSRSVLPEVLGRDPVIDVFLHDSEHSWDNMDWEFRTALDHLAPRGLLVADDALANDAFLDVATAPLGPRSWAITTEGMGVMRTGTRPDTVPG